MSDQTKGHSKFDLDLLRQRLHAAPGPEYWRSLEELAGTEEFRDFLHNEFPSLLPSRADTLNRRDLLKVMGASLALAGLSACTSRPAEKIVPYVRAPEEFVPGRPLFYATAMPLAGFAVGLLVESHLGRPTKIEGNPQHPASLGATDAHSQASILTLYDPDRSQAVMQNGRMSSWDAAATAIENERGIQAAKGGAGFRLLTETVSSPTLAAQIRELLAMFPGARWHQYDPLGGDGRREGARLAFGSYVNAVYRVENADVILSLDSDFLAQGPGCLRYSREWAARRQPGRRGMNRVYAVESTPSNTGAVADHRLPLVPDEIEPFARLIAGKLGVAAGPTPDFGQRAAWINALVKDLQQHRGSSLVIPGEYQSPAVHALAHAMNEALGNAGRTVVYTDPVEAGPTHQGRSLLELYQDMGAGKVDTLLIIGGNPVYTAPVDLEFGQQLMKVKQRFHLSLYQDETSRLCNWHIPEAFYLEAWSDARAFDGTASIIQPLIAPLYNGKSAHEVLAAFVGRAGSSGYDLVREFWRGRAPSGDFEAFWRTALHDGVVADSTLAPRPATAKLDAATLSAKAAAPRRHEPSEVEIIFRPDPAILDGRFANNGWLQELPRPLTKLTWENAVWMSPETSHRLGGLQPREMVELRYRERTVHAPVWIVPGHADDCITVHLGYGRTHAGKVGSGTGFNAGLVRTSDAPWAGRGATVRRIAGQALLPCTQDHHSMEYRKLVRSASAAEFGRNPEFAREAHHELPDMSLFPAWDYSKSNRWGMSINLGACTGCSACVVACQAENNIPVVGSDQVSRGREMHWLRIDRYYEGGLDNPATHFQPVPCMHCENAPCELVCPVNATNHSRDGLNQMVYNRCVGTRYCSNNCPYKVRRFNFLQYSDYETPSLKPLRNPDVTVRARGVMEKCTYCVQRIMAARITAEKEDRPIRDGEVVTACQGACPTNAIVFGDMNDNTSQVAQQKSSPLDYGILTDLNTRPRTTYLAKLKNPNPAIEKE